MSMLNQALPADVHSVKSLTADDPGITLTALHATKGWWALAAVSGKAQAQQISVQMPVPKGAQTWRLLRLFSPSPTDSNEDQENVRIVEEQAVSENGRINLTVSPYGFVVVLPGKR